MVKNASGNDAWRPDDPSPEAEAIEGRPLDEPRDVAMPQPPTHPEGPIPGEYEKGAEPKAASPETET